MVFLLLSEVCGYERQQTQMTGTLNSESQLALISCAGTSYTTRKDFPLVVGEFLEYIDVFVIDVDETRLREQTFFATVVGFLRMLWIL